MAHWIGVHGWVKAAKRRKNISTFDVRQRELQTQNE